LQSTAPLLKRRTANQPVTLHHEAGYLHQLFWTLHVAFRSHARSDRIAAVTSASFKARRVNMKNFFAELKRRNVYKVAISFASCGKATTL
jgi:hypothetical protein